MREKRQSLIYQVTLGNALLVKGCVESVNRSGSTIRHIDPMQLQRKPNGGLSS